MSSPSLLSEFSPRIRHRRPNPSMLALNQQSRNALTRMLKHKTFKDELYAFYQRQSEGLPVIPAYLSNTVYAQLVKQQHLIFAQTKSLSTPKANQEPFQTKEDSEAVFHETVSASQPSDTNLKLPSPQQYDALHNLLIGDSFKMALAMQDLRLPTAWDIKAKGEHIDISLDHMQLTYRGSGKDDGEVSSARANYAMRRQCGIYYFEIQVISKGADGKIGIGFCRRINSLDRFPGWEEHSWGYHGENGNTHSGPSTGKPYGPKYGTGDIIGCGIDFRDMSAFYTKNGIFLGTAFKKIKETDIYPFVGFKTAGEKIEGNFGSKPFKFDIQQYLANEKRDLLNRISLKPTIDCNMNRSTIINESVANSLADQVVMEYLKHNGYNKSAKTLEESLLLKGNTLSLDTCSTIEDHETFNRQEIRKSILQGDIDRVFSLCNTFYPSVLDDNPLILFRLKCRKFMEMVKRVQQNMSHANALVGEDEAQSLAVSQTKQTPPSKRSPNSADLDSYVDNKKKQKLCDELYLGSFVDAMSYGNKLKEQYTRESQTNETIRSELLTTFSTLAYADLSDRAVAYLFETPQIEQVASELNSAILVSLGKYPNSSLERIYRQTSTTIEELVLAGNAKAALLQPERDCFNFTDL